MGLSVSKGTPSVLLDKRGPVAYVTLSRPEVLNALDLATHEALSAIWDEFERDDALRVAVLTGAGERAFSVGQDVKELARRLEAGAPPTSLGSRGLPGWPRLTERFSLRKPVIARVNGFAYGGGFELALACDIVIAAEHASFALPEAKLGLIPGAGGVLRLPRQMPYKTALGHLLTGRPMSAARAHALGLVNEVVPHEQLDACVDGWVRDMLRCSPLSLAAIKEIAASSYDMDLEQAFRAEYPAERARLAGLDCIEGPRAFVDKRPPVWAAPASRQFPLPVETDHEP